MYLSNQRFSLAIQLAAVVTLLIGSAACESLYTIGTNGAAGPTPNEVPEPRTRLPDDPVCDGDDCAPVATDDSCDDLSLEMPRGNFVSSPLPPTLICPEPGDAGYQENPCACPHYYQYSWGMQHDEEFRFCHEWTAEQVKNRQREDAIRADYSPYTSCLKKRIKEVNRALYSVKLPDKKAAALERMRIKAQLNDLSFRYSRVEMMMIAEGNLKFGAPLYEFSPMTARKEIDFYSDLANMPSRRAARKLPPVNAAVRSILGFSQYNGPYFEDGLEEAYILSP